MLQTLGISINDILYSLDLWVTWVSIKREAVRYLMNIHVSWESAKSEGWETPIKIVWFENGTNLTQSLDVLIIWSKGMQGTWIVYRKI